MFSGQIQPHAGNMAITTVHTWKDRVHQLWKLLEQISLPSIIHSCHNFQPSFEFPEACYTHCNWTQTSWAYFFPFLFPLCLETLLHLIFPKLPKTLCMLESFTDSVLGQESQPPSFRRSVVLTWHGQPEMMPSVLLYILTSISFNFIPYHAKFPHASLNTMMTWVLVNLQLKHCSNGSLQETFTEKRKLLLGLGVWFYKSSLTSTLYLTFRFPLRWEDILWRSSCFSLNLEVDLLIWSVLQIWWRPPLNS